MTVTTFYPQYDATGQHIGTNSAGALTDMSVTMEADARVYTGRQDGGDKVPQVNYRALFKFDLSSVVGATISAASLVLTLDLASTADAGEEPRVRRVTVDWNESGLNDGDVADTITGQTGAMSGANKSVGTEWSVSDAEMIALVQDIANGTANYGFSIAPMATMEDEEYWVWRSRQYTGTADDPALTVTYSTNELPNAPTIGIPASGQTVNREVVNRFTWTHSDPDGDTQQGFDLRYRVVGDPTWIDVHRDTPNQYYDVPALTFDADDYEAQVRTYDAEGAGAYTASRLFTAIDAPLTPPIIDPINGQAIATTTYEVEWTATDQQSYQVRTVADDGGIADDTTVYYDSGEVVDSVARTANVPFPTDGRTEHVQVRVNQSGIWSGWSTAGPLTIDYSNPPTPTIVVLEVDSLGYLGVAMTNPSPGAGEVAAQYNEVWRREAGDTDDGIRIADEATTGSTYRDYFSAHLTDYEYRVAAVALSGSKTWSAWATSGSDPVTPDPSGYYGGY